MSIRVSIVSTRTGDDGTTGLGDKTRVPKDAPRITALGDVDELNSAIGLWRTTSLPAAASTFDAPSMPISLAMCVSSLMDISLRPARLSISPLSFWPF